MTGLPRTYSAGAVANYMLDRAEDEGVPISQMKLQKLVYIAYGWVLALLDRKLFEEPVLAWKHGPVIRSLYDEFKHFGSDPIGMKSAEFDLDAQQLTEPRLSGEDDDVQVVLEKVWEIYKRYSASDLRNKTHEADTPWSRTYAGSSQDAVIPDNLIREHFAAKIRTYLDNAR